MSRIVRRITSSSSGIDLRRSMLFAAVLVIAVAAVACGTDNSTSVGNVPTPGDAPTSTPVGEFDADSPAVGSSSGKRAPGFTATTYAHGTYSLTATVGRPVLINFWFPSCPPCRAEMPALQTAYEKYGEEVDFIGVQQIGLDTAESGKAFLANLGITYPNFADSIVDPNLQVQLSYQILSYPTTIFLDRDHKITRTWIGALTEDDLDEQISVLLAS